MDVLQQIGVGFGFLFVALLCIGGVVLSCLSFSGTWVVLVAVILSRFLVGPEFPVWWLSISYAVVSGLVEGVEAVAGAWGVKKRGGSGLAGFAALVGGLGGLFLGTFIPIPLFGSLLGMMIGGFALTYAVEHHRLKKSSHAAHIAWGAVLGRVFVIFVKVMVTLAMIGGLVVALIWVAAQGGPAT